MRLMTRSGLRRSADIILVMAVTGAIAYVAVVWTVGNWGDTSLWDMATHAFRLDEGRCLCEHRNEACPQR